MSQPPRRDSCSHDSSEPWIADASASPQHKRPSFITSHSSLDENPLAIMLKETAAEWGLQGDGKVPLSKADTIVNNMAGRLGSDLKTKRGNKNLDINLLPGGSKQLLEKYEDESAREEKLERLEKLRAAKRSSKKVGTYTELTKEMKEMEFAAGMEAIDKKILEGGGFREEAFAPGSSFAEKFDEFAEMLTSPIFKVILPYLPTNYPLHLSLVFVLVVLATPVMAHGFQASFRNAFAFTAVTWYFAIWFVGGNDSSHNYKEGVRGRVLQRMGVALVILWFCLLLRKICGDYGGLSRFWAS